MLSEILLGFEQFKFLQDLADAELFAHIQYHDNVENYIHNTDKFSKTETGSSHEKPHEKKFTETKGELSITHMHSVNELFTVEKGQVELVLTPYKKVHLNEGESIILPKGILHGSLINSNVAEYTVSEHRGC